MRNICISILAVTTIILFVKGCDNVSGPDSDETDLLHSFSYEIFDESGELLTSITHEKIGDAEITASAGFFGNEFMPPWLLEAVSEQIGVDPEELKINEIYLHAETDGEADLNSATLKFSLPSADQWKTGNFHATGTTVENRLNFIKTIWQARQDNRPDFSAKIPGFEFNNTEPSGHVVSISYSETGFATETSYGVRIDPDGTQYFQLEGSLILDDATDNLLEGRFTTKLLGFPMDVLYYSDEFPDDPEYHIIHVSGSFTAVRGDYFDLMESTSKLFE